VGKWWEFFFNDGFGGYLQQLFAPLVENS